MRRLTVGWARRLTKPQWLIVAAMALAACSSSYTFNTGSSYFSYRYDFADVLLLATGKSIEVVPIGSAFGGSKDEEGPQLTALMQRTPLGARTRFTTTPDEDTVPNMRVFALLNLNVVGHGREYCREESPPEAPERTDRGGRVYVHFVYCKDDRYMSAVVGSAAADSFETPAMVDFIRLATVRLLPANNPARGNRDRQCRIAVSC